MLKTPVPVSQLARNWVNLKKDVNAASWTLCKMTKCFSDIVLKLVFSYFHFSAACNILGVVVCQICSKSENSQKIIILTHEQAKHNDAPLTKFCLFSFSNSQACFSRFLRSLSARISTNEALSSLVFFAKKLSRLSNGSSEKKPHQAFSTDPDTRSQLIFAWNSQRIFNL